MAIYCTFFVCKPQELTEGFPGWLPPLPHPVKREFRNPMTKQVSVIETRRPEWPREDAPSPIPPRYKVAAIQGSYQEYLEGRQQPFVRGKPHWCAKELTETELTPLGEIFGLNSVMEPEPPLYNRPSSGAFLEQCRAEFVAKLISLDEQATTAVAKSWATSMSSPEFTHSASGNKISDGWTESQATKILLPLAALAKRAEPGMTMFLLVET
jgi:hypothetical protein